MRSARPPSWDLIRPSTLLCLPLCSCPSLRFSRLSPPGPRARRSARPFPGDRISPAFSCRAGSLASNLQFDDAPAAPFLHRRQNRKSKRNVPWTEYWRCPPPLSRPDAALFLRAFLKSVRAKSHELPPETQLVSAVANALCSSEERGGKAAIICSRFADSLPSLPSWRCCRPEFPASRKLWQPPRCRHAATRFTARCTIRNRAQRKRTGAIAVRRACPDKQTLRCVPVIRHRQRQLLQLNIFYAPPLSSVNRPSAEPPRLPNPCFFPS